MRPNQRKICFIALSFIVVLAVAIPFQLVKAQSGTTTVTVSPSNSSPSVGQSIIVTIKIADVQNLYGLDVAVTYNNAVLQLTNQQPDLGKTAVSSGGVLYGTPLTQDVNNLQSGGLYYNTTLTTPTQYYLYATSANPAQPFSGSGTIATLTFKVIGTGQSPLTLTSDLADHPAVDETSNPITHNDISATINVGSISTSSPTSSTSSAPTSTSSSSPTPTTPEFPMAATLAILIVLVSAAAMLSVKKLRKPT